MNRIDLKEYASSIEKFLSEATNVDFNSGDTHTLGGQGVTRGIKTPKTNSGNSGGTNNITPEESKKVSKEPQQPEETVDTSSDEIEKIKIVLKKLTILKKKFDDFRKQCEANNLSPEDIIKNNQGGEQQQNEAPEQPGTPQ